MRFDVFREGGQTLFRIVFDHLPGRVLISLERFEVIGKDDKQRSD